MVNVEQALKLKKVGADFDDLTNSYVLAANSKEKDTFEVEAGQDYFIQGLWFYMSGAQGMLLVEIDGRAVIYRPNSVAPELHNRLLEINEWATGDVTVTVHNTENISRLVSYSLPILRIISGKTVRESVETVLGAFT